MGELTLAQARRPRWKPSPHAQAKSSPAKPITGKAKPNQAGVAHPSNVQTGVARPAGAGRDSNPRMRNCMKIYEIHKKNNDMERMDDPPLQERENA